MSTLYHGSAHHALSRFTDVSRALAIRAWNWASRSNDPEDWETYEIHERRWREDLRRLNEYEAANGLPLTLDDLEE